MSLLEIKELSKRFGGLAAVNNVDFSVNEGEILASSARTAPARARCSS